MKKYFPLEQYSMKCRLYPNKTQAKIIDNQFHMIHVYHNNLIHDMRINGKYLTKVEDEKILEIMFIFQIFIIQMVLNME